MSDLEALLDRAASDPDFRQHLTEDPAGAARAAGLALSPEELSALPDMLRGGNAVEVEPLEARVSYGNHLSARGRRY